MDTSIFSMVLALIHVIVYMKGVEVTPYFERNVLGNPDRPGITKEMCEEVVASPEHSETQEDGRAVLGGGRGAGTCTCGWS